jgi:flagellin-specific chaperone FliS
MIEDKVKKLDRIPTYEELLPPIIHNDIDFSILTQEEWTLLQKYWELRAYFVKNYPTQKLDDAYDINVWKAKFDAKAGQFRRALDVLHGLFEKMDYINSHLIRYEIACIRLYCKYLLNRLVKADNPNSQKEIDQFLSMFRPIDVYEIVTAYFAICRKHGLPVHEEPFYFLSPKERQKIKYEADVLKRTTFFDQNEIFISILEGLR